MIAKKLVLAGVMAAVALGGTAIVLEQVTPASEAPPAAGADASPGDSGTPHPSGTGPASTAGAGKGNDSPSGVDAGGTSSSAGPDAAGPGVLEVLPPASAAPTGLPKPTPPAALIRTPLPAPGSAQGKVVDGFPVNVLTFPEGTVLVSTSVSSSDRTLQVTADGVVERNAAQVAGHFQQTLLKLGFRSEAAPAAEGQQSIRLSRGKDAVTVAITTTGTGSTRFTLLGTLHA